MKSESQLRESIDRFRQVFWEKKSTGRPPVGVVSTDIYMPVKYLRRSFLRDRIEPEDIRQDLIMTDYEFAFAHRPVNIDDWMPFAAPWRAIPWLEAWCGCPVNYSDGSLAPGHIYKSIEDLTNAPIPSSDKWFACLQDQTHYLLNTTPDDCWISPSILRGCSDVLAAMRGIEGFCQDLLVAPELVNRNASRINWLLLSAIDMNFSIVKQKYGGYGHIYGYWSPGPTIVIQEDVLGFCSPEIYRDIFMQHNIEVVSHMGNYILFHLHSTGFQHYKHVLEIPGLAGLQITIEANGPSLKQLLPVFREALEHSRLILFVDSRFDELAEILPKMPSEGLYIIVPETFIKSDYEFRKFISSIRWNKK